MDLDYNAFRKNDGREYKTTGEEGGTTKYEQIAANEKEKEKK